MRLTLILAIGAALGLISTLGIYFDTRAQGRIRVNFAGAIRGLLVALLVTFATPKGAGWILAIGFGALYGALIATMVVLAQGTNALKHIAYLLPPAWCQVR
jgi:hypothetical protein